MPRLEKFLPLARDESVVERQEHPDKSKGQWVFASEIRTRLERTHAETLCKLGNFRIIDDSIQKVLDLLP